MLWKHAASWNRMSAAYNPGMVYACTQSYAEIAAPTKLIPGL